MMNLHSLENSPGARKSRKRLGRGESSGTGKTAGRGMKGQHSRTGSGYSPTFEGGQMPLYRRLPKYGFKNPNRTEFAPVNVEQLNRFEDGSEINQTVLRKSGLVNGKCCLVKILGKGTLERKLTVTANAFSASAKAKIEAAGGTAATV
jgi:large subunit ribosomal protein L15